MKTRICFLSAILVVSALTKRALQKAHEKSQLEKWEDKFLRRLDQFDQTNSLIGLISKIATEELSQCSTVFLYDHFTQSSDELILEKLFRMFPLPYIHGYINDEYNEGLHFLAKPDTCISYIMFLKDVMMCERIIGPQSTNKVVLVARSSQWRVYEFLSSEQSQNFLNLLVIAKSEKIVSSNIELPYILYTHTLYIDALGSSKYQVITSWRNGSFTSNPVQLFPRKISTGFAGHRFIIALAHQPPFVIKKGLDNNNNMEWDGIEIRLVNLLSKLYNFTTDYREAKNWAQQGSIESVAQTVKIAKANLGIAGVYITTQRLISMDVSHMHSQDCAAFISLTSTALPRYRAILGPFHWSVWVALTIVYLVAIFPLAFSDKHSLRPIIEKPQEIENMFWYVFGTFTNAFSFVGENSWSKTDKLATRLLIGFYWIFTIIITACYTGSIIAFVTLPVSPSTVDTPEQLISGHFQIGTLDKGGWQYWFENSTDPVTAKLFKDIDLVPDVASGLKNITKAFFWPYAFLGSKAELDYIVRTNVTKLNKRSQLHISTHCFVPFGVGLIYPKNSIYSHILDTGLLNIVQSGLMIKIKNDVEWQMIRTATGKLLAADSYGKSIKSLTVEDRALTLDDTQGMFLLLALGFIVGGASLLSEWMGGCFHICQGKRKKSGSSIQSNYRSHDVPTPREKLDSIQFNNSFENHMINEEVPEPRNCIVHKQDDIDEQIDKLFDFDKFFGDADCGGCSAQEELDEERNEVKDA